MTARSVVGVVVAIGCLAAPVTTSSATASRPRLVYGGHLVPSAGPAHLSVFPNASPRRRRVASAAYRRAKAAANRSRPRLHAARAITPALARGRGAATQLSEGIGFPGLDSGQCRGCYPADPQIAVGPSFVVEMVNTSVSVFDRAGVKASTFPLRDILGGHSMDLSDPQVLYDAQSGRWFAVALDIAHDGTSISVSDTSDPRSGWTNYGLEYTSAACPDQPRLGVSDNVVAYTVELFTGNCRQEDTTVEGGVIFVLNKHDLLTARRRPAFVDYGPSPAFTNYTPVQSLSPTPVQYFASAKTPSSKVLRLVQYLGAPPTSAFGATNTLLVTPLTTPPGAVQPGTRQRVDTGDDRLSDASFLNGIIYVAANDACDDGTRTLKSCSRIMEISSTDHRLLGEADVGFRGGYGFYTALRPDAAGNAIAEFGYSSARVYPSIGVVGVRGLLAGENGNNLTHVSQLALGSSPDLAPGGRWGDYMGASQDPLNPAVVWIAAQVGDTAGNIEWGTHIDTVSFTRGARLPPDGHQVYPGYYSGRTRQHERIVLRTSGDGRRMMRVALAATERCSVRHHRLRVRAALLSDAASRLIGLTGRFTAAGRVRGARVSVTGTFFSTHVFGSLTVSEHNYRWGTCRSGPVLWTAT